MFNIVGILLALIISQAARGEGQVVGWESLAAFGAATLGVLFFTNMLAGQLIERWEMAKLRVKAAETAGIEDIRRRALREAELLQRRLPSVRMGTDVLILGLYGAVSWLFGWTDYVSQVWHVPMYLDLLPNLLPYFAMLVASWVAQYRLEKHLRGSDWRVAKFTGFQLRANLMTIAPIAIVYLVYWAVIRYLPIVDDLRSSFEFLEIGLQFALVILISVFVPVIVRLILPGGKLPEGRLRRRLQTFAKDRKLKINQIIVWRTGSRHFATAFVIGLFSPFRYVFITDALLHKLSEDEVLAVYAHELGHVKHRHLWWLLAFILSFTVILLGMMFALQWTGIAGVVPVSQLEYVALGGLLLYAYFMFGYISRRFERQADAFAAEHTSPELLAQVFLKLGSGNPVAFKKHGWRHFSLERRVRELVQTREHPEMQREFASELRRGLGVAVVVTLLALAMLARPVQVDVVTGMATYNLTQYDRARASGANAERLEDLRASTIERSRAMGELDEDFERIALWYEGIVEGLAGNDSEALNDLMAEVEQKKDDAATPEEEQHWENWITQIEATETSIRRARRNGTLFDTELTEELKRKGLIE